MKKFSLLSLGLILFAVFSGCDALDNLKGGKTEEKKAVTSDNDSDQKIRELEDKMKKMEEETKARIELENKAKAEEELKTKLEQEIRAKIEAEQKTAAQTQPVTQPKVVEKVIIRDSTSPAPAVAKPKGWVRLCDQRGGGGPCATISLGKNIPDLNFVSTSGGERDANDMCASVQYNIPAGWAAVIYRHQNYAGEHMTVGGSGGRDITDTLNDQCTSIMWVQQ